MEKAYLLSTYHVQTASPVTILQADRDRRYVAFYGVSGACIIHFDSVFYFRIDAHVFWEPRFGITNEIQLYGTPPGDLVMLTEINRPR